MGCRKRLSSWARFFAFFSAVWMLADIVLDYLTVNEYKNECDAITKGNSNGSQRAKWFRSHVNITIGIFQFSTARKADITCLLWPLGALSMVLPTVAMVLYIYCCGGHKGPWWEKVAYGPFYFISAPVYAVITSFMGLCCASDQNKNKKKVAYLKLAEVLCEALPQVTITATYLVIKGMPWIKPEGTPNWDPGTPFEEVMEKLRLASKIWLPFISGIWSIVMIFIGTLTGAMACQKVRTEEHNQRREEQEQNAELRWIRRRKDEMKTKVWNTGDEENYVGLLNELREKDDPEMKREDEQISKHRKRRAELEAKSRNKKEDIEHENIKTELRKFRCAEMRNVA